MRNAPSTSVSSAEAAMAHPTTRREHTSSTAAKESQPTSRPNGGDIPIHFSLGCVAVKSRSKRFGGTRALGPLRVVLVQPRRLRGQFQFAHETRPPHVRPTLFL